MSTRYDSVKFEKSSTKKSCISPLHFQYIRLKLINACFVSQSSLEPLLVLILLASTDLNCNFVVFYQTILQSAQIGSQIIWQFVSAAITDRTETWAQYFLLTTLLVQTATDVAMYFLSSNKWVLLVLFIIRFSLVQQIGNSIGKIFKMRIQLVLKMAPEHQLAAFNNLAITGDFLGRLFSVVCVFGLSLLLVKLINLPYHWMRNIFFLALIGGDLIAVICTASIRNAYYLPSPESNMPTTAGAAIAAPEDSGVIPLIEDESPRGTNNSDYMESFPDVDTALLNDDVEPTATLKTENMNTLQYLSFSVKEFWRNRLLFHSTLHLWMVTTLLAFVTIVLRFDVTSQGTSKDPTRENYCGGLLLNLIETQLDGEVCRLVGAVLYQGYMVRISPLHFYKAVYLVYAAILAMLLTGVVFPLGPTVGSVFLGIITVFIYLSMLYGANLGSVVMDSSMAGFVFGVQGSGIQILALIPVFTVMVVEKTHIPIPFITGYCVMHAVWSGCFALWFSIRYRRKLNALDDSPRSDSKLKRCLLGH